MMTMNKEKAIWQDGRLQTVVQKFSPNFSSRPDHQIIDLIVLHNISLPPFEYGSNAIEQLFLNQIEPIKPNDDPFFAQLVGLRVSSHFVIRRDGVIQQFVSCDDMAYHAGVSCFRGREKCNAFSIGIELEGCDFEAFTEEQYCSLENLLLDLMEQYPIQAVTGHQDIAPQRKTDPGHFFDWARLHERGFPIDRNR